MFQKTNMPEACSTDMGEGAGMRSRITNVARGALLAVAGLHLIVFLFYVSAAVCGAVGVGFVPMRLVSVAATLGSLALIYLLVRRRAGPAAPVSGGRIP